MDNKIHANEKPEVSAQKTSHGIVKINNCLHPREKSRFMLAVGIVIPITLIYILLAFGLTYGLGFIIVPIIIFFAWMVVNLFRAYLLGSCAEITPDNFPEIHGMLEQIKLNLDYPKKVEAYVYQNGEVNAFLIRRFRTRIILLPHELLTGMLKEEGKSELIWILSRAVGHLKAKHLRLWWLNLIIESLEKLQILNLFLYPWERATQYSGDRIGLAVCFDLKAAIRAINKLMLGNEISSKTTLLGALNQRKKLSGTFFGWLAECLSTHPHLTNRIASLINWSKEYDPSLYKQFMDSQPNHVQVESLLLQTEGRR